MKRKNIVIIVMDTMRLDEFHNIENSREGFGKAGFEEIKNCIAPSPWTLPSHASLFTGMYPREHGSHETKKIKSLDIERIKLRKQTVLDDVSRLGYTTYGISANPYVHPMYGFAGFSEFREESYFTDIYGSVFEVSKRVKGKVAGYRNTYGTSSTRIALGILRDNPNLFLETLGSAALHTPGSAIKKLRAKLVDGWPIEKGGANTVRYIRNQEFKEPYLIFANLMEAHDPYVGKHGKDMNWSTPFLKEKPGREELDLWKRLYRKGSERAYAYALGIASSLLKRYGKDQLIVATSDHGQEFGEHGFIGHGVMLHDELVRVPMYVHGSDVPNPTKGFSTLVNLRSLVSDYSGKGMANAKRLYSSSVRSESFGVPANISMVPGIDRRALARNERERIRTFRGSSLHGSDSREL